jgi:hypothetical protein
MSKIINIRHVRAQLLALKMFAPEIGNPLVADALEAQGIDFPHALNIVGPIIKRDVTFDGDGSCCLDYFGTSSFIFAVTDEDGEHELDLVAWAARAPEIFATFLRQAPLIGAANLFNHRGDASLSVHRSPLAWLQADCMGIVVLEPIAAATVLARVPGNFEPEDVEHAWHLVKAGVLPKRRLIVPARGPRAAA